MLIIGGTSSIAKEQIRQLESNGYVIETMTYRQKDKVFGKYNWVKLDIENRENVLLFMANLKTIYSKIIINIGNRMENEKISFDEADCFYKSYLVNYVFLANKLMKNLEKDGQLISISSQAANDATLDIHYSAVKAGCQAAVRSLSMYAKEGQSVYSISPGMIDDEIREKIAKAILNSNYSFNGKVIEIGY